MSEVKKVIKVFEDGAYEDVEHGVLIECNGDDFNLQFMDVSPMNMQGSNRTCGRNKKAWA